MMNNIQSSLVGEYKEGTYIDDMISAVWSTSDPFHSPKGTQSHPEGYMMQSIVAVTVSNNRYNNGYIYSQI